MVHSMLKLKNPNKTPKQPQTLEKGKSQHMDAHFF